MKMINIKSLRKDGAVNIAPELVQYHSEVKIIHKKIHDVNMSYF